jgi:hypothetical protein
MTSPRTSTREVLLCTCGHRLGAGRTMPMHATAGCSGTVNAAVPSPAARDRRRSATPEMQGEGPRSLMPSGSLVARSFLDRSRSFVGIRADATVEQLHRVGSAALTCYEPT